MLVPREPYDANKINLAIERAAEGLREQLGLTGGSVIGKTREEWLELYPDVRASADWELVLVALRDRRPFRTSDGYLCTFLINDRQWRTCR